MRRLFPAVLVLFSLSTVATLEAATVTKVADSALTPLRVAPAGGHVRLDALPLYDSQRSAIDLEEFQLWAAGGKVLVHSERGVTALDPPNVRYFRGAVNGDPESFAFFAVDQTTSRIEGIVTTRDAKYALSGSRRVLAPNQRRDAASDTQLDYFVTRFEAEDEAPQGLPTWECKLDKEQLVTPALPRVANASIGDHPVAQALAATQSYAITVDVETDFELFQNAGSSTANLTNYVTNLTGAVATIYKRDLNIYLQQRNVNIYTSGAADPWLATDSTNGLYELGDKYHNAAIKPGGRTSSAVVMLSGLNYGGGIAWEGVIGGADFSQGGHWGGPYAWCGGIGNLGTAGLGAIPDPNAITNGTKYGMPTGTQNYWPLVEYAHELGHNLAGHHTHCVAITDAERQAAGFTDGSTANFVDHCYGAGGAGCYSGANYVAGSPGVNKGTIMSYCHNVFTGAGVPQSRFVFGPATEPSHHELDDYMLSASRSGNIVTATSGMSMSAITKPASLAPGASGTASVSAPASSYLWQITNGTITGGQGTTSITFTAGATGVVTLRAMAFNSGRVGVTDSATVTIGSVVCSQSLTRTSASYSKNAASDVVGVTASCAWTAVSNAAWLSVTANASGSGSASTINVGYNVTANNTGAARTGTLTIAGITYTITQSATAAKGGDLNNDGQNDLLWWNGGTGAAYVWYLSNGHYVSGAALPSMGSNAWHLVAEADFNADGKLDLVWRNFSTGANTIWLMNGTAITQQVALPSAGVTWFIEASADVTGDGKPDLIWHDHATGSCYVWQMNGTTYVQGLLLQGAPAPWHIAGVSDVTGDGVSDIIWRNGGNGQNAIWQLSGLTVTANTALPQVADVNWQIGAVADYNGDGVADFYWRNVSTGDHEIWFMKNGQHVSSMTGEPERDRSWYIAGPR